MKSTAEQTNAAPKSDGMRQIKNLACKRLAQLITAAAPIAAELAALGVDEHDYSQLRNRVRTPVSTRALADILTQMSTHPATQATSREGASQ